MRGPAVKLNLKIKEIEYIGPYKSYANDTSYTFISKCDQFNDLRAL